MMRRLLPANKVSHDEMVEFADAACTRCGNCCRELGSTEFTWHDLRKLSKKQKRSTTQIVKEYRLEKNGRAWMAPQPCPLLKGENECREYGCRPRSCRWFPMRLYTIRQNDPRVQRWIPLCDALRLTLERFEGGTLW